MSQHSGRRRILSLIVCISTLALALTLSTAGTAAAHSALPSPKSQPASATSSSGQSSRASTLAGSSASCKKLLITLNGTNPPTQTCLVAAPTSPSGTVNPQLVQPKTSTATCGDTLNLWLDANQQGDEVCFNGTGFVNLTNVGWCHWRYIPPATWVWDCFDSWNDRVSSWASHSQSGGFYVDINGNGSKMHYNTNSSGNLFGSPIPNDTLSSLCIGSCP